MTKKKRLSKVGTTKSKGINVETCTFKLIAFHPPSQVFQQYPELKALECGHYSIWRETYYSELFLLYFHSNLCLYVPVSI